MLSPPIQKFFVCIPANAADASVLNPNGIRTFLTNGMSRSFIEGKKKIE